MGNGIPPHLLSLLGEDYAVFLMAKPGILANATPKQLGIAFQVDKSEQEITAKDLDAIGMTREDALYAEAGDGCVINIRVEAQNDADVCGQLYGRLKVGDDVAWLLAILIMQPNFDLRVVGPDERGRVLLYSTAIPLRDWLYGVIMVSLAHYVLVPPTPEILDGFGVTS